MKHIVAGENVITAELSIAQPFDPFPSALIAADRLSPYYAGP